MSALALAVVLLAWSANANTVDKCVYLNNFDLSAALNSELSISSIPGGYGDLSQCLCVSGISAFIGQNPPAAIAVQQTSMSQVEDAISIMIDSASGQQTCTYPNHSQATCMQGEICGFTCDSGYIRSGNDCVCSSACPSAVMRKRSHGEDLQMVIGTRLCPSGQEVCGGFSGPKSYECIDTKTTLDSCGGCVFPLSGRNATGTDCSAILGAANVRCIDSKCAVMSCMAGWNLPEDGQACIPA